MIFLIEDKTSRRIDYGWTDEKISATNDVLTVVENAVELINLKSSILREGNVVLFHESFARRESREMAKEVKGFLHSLEIIENIYIAYFSGSKSQRKLEEKICNLNFDPLYKNLATFINYYKQGCTDFRYLMFGEHPEIEDQLLNLIEEANNEDIDEKKINSSKRILVFRTSEVPAIQFPVSNANVREDCDYDCTDADLIKLVEEQSDKGYDAIYVPLCMGETLSDFLGLRLAMFFKLLNTTNKYAHIFIYGVADFSLFYKNECAEVLKMPNVSYVFANSQHLINSLQIIRIINEEEYRLGLKTIHLNVPNSIGDNHSIANKWGIYRWSLALEDSDDDIENNQTEIYNSLYFRYLMALYPQSDMPGIEKNKLVIKKDEEATELNVLYVDDEADDGWYELLCKLLYDDNDIRKFDYIGQSIKSKSQNQIVDYVMEKVKNVDANLVILDLRLHPDDFTATRIDNITGYKLLHKIKHHNRGIQVLMFSATNKIWNLQALQNEEVDGFIMKEAPENSADPLFTEESITSFINLIGECSNKVYRKKLWPRIQNLNKRLDYLLRFDNIENKYANNILTLLSMVEDAMFDRNPNHSYDNEFINLFRIIELTANEWIGSKEIQYGNKFYFFKDNGDSLLYFKSGNPRPNGELKPGGKLSYEHKISNILYRVGAFDTTIASLVEKRNSFTHPNGKLTYFSVDDVTQVFNVVDKIIMHIEDN